MKSNISETTLEQNSSQQTTLSSRPRVLLADDDRGVRESLGKFLRNAGCQVTFAAHGGQVLEQALNDRIDLLLLDLNMPEINGWATLHHLQCLRPELPVIVITAQPNQREWMRSGGARALFEKPLDLANLLQTIQELTNPEAIARPESFRHSPPSPADPSLARYYRRWGLNE